MYFAKFHILQFFKISCLSALLRRLDNFRATWNYTQNHENNNSFANLAKFYILWLLLENGLTSLQLRRIFHGIVITSKFLRRTTAWAIFTKMCILRNFTFYNLSENLGFQFLEEDLVNLQLLLLPCSIVTISKLHKKNLQ